MANLYTKIVTALQGRYVGQDAFGNKYFQSRRPSLYGRYRRWVIYARDDDGSEVPPDYHAWLHRSRETFPDASSSVPVPSWHLPHHPNMTGTIQVWRPNAAYAGGVRPKARSDYTAWRP